MAAVRGRKRTEDPTPNRARDIQRAFRARRAAHLESLEDRINELEEENNYFRALLNMPPSNRPILGKGPTGRGLAKSRSRITVDNFKSTHGSPVPQTPPSDDPSTPTVDCPIPLPPAQSENFSQIPVVHCQEGDVDPNANGAFVFPQDKIIDPCVDQFAFNSMTRSSSIDHSMGGLHSEFEAVSLNHSVDGSISQGMYPGYNWAPLPLQGADMHSTPMNQRAFSFTQQTAAISAAPRAVPAHMRPTHGHRRANTEPQSLGSLVAQGFNPGHRATSSEALGSGSPSPPPLPIRAPYPVHVYQ